MVDDLSIEPRAYDRHGLPIYEDDLLDLRWSVLIEDVGGEGYPLEGGVHSLIFTDDVDLIRRGVEVISLLAERHIQRQGHPSLLDEESGRAWARARDLEALRAKPAEYDRIRRAAGWPEDPSELDDDQLGDAILVTVHPDWIEDMISRDREDTDD